MLKKQSKNNYLKNNKFNLLIESESDSNYSSETESESESELESELESESILSFINFNENIEFKTFELIENVNDNFEKNDYINNIKNQNNDNNVNDNNDENDENDNNDNIDYSNINKENNEDIHSDNKTENWVEVKNYRSSKNIFHNIELDKLSDFPLKDDLKRREIKYFKKKVNFTKSYLFNLMFLLSGNCKINHLNFVTKKIDKNNGLKYFITNESNIELGIHKWAEECVYYIEHYYDDLDSFENSRLTNQNLFFKKFLIVSGLWQIFNLHDKNFDFIQNHFYTYYMKIYLPTLKELESIVMPEPVSLYLLYLSSLKNVSIPRMDFEQEINENNINIMIKNIFFNLLVLNITNNTIKHKKDEKYWPSNCHKIFYYQKNLGYIKTINTICEETKKWIPLWFESRIDFSKDCIKNNKPFDFIYEFYFDFIRMIGLNEYLNISVKYQSLYSKEFIHFCFNNYINDENDKIYYINELNLSEKWKI